MNPAFSAVVALNTLRLRDNSVTSPLNNLIFQIIFTDQSKRESSCWDLSESRRVSIP